MSEASPEYPEGEKPKAGGDLAEIPRCQISQACPFAERPPGFRCAAGGESEGEDGKPVPVCALILAAIKIAQAGTRRIAVPGDNGGPTFGRRGG